MKTTANTDWLMAIYGAIGAEYPVITQIAAIVLGGIIFGGGWWVIEGQFRFLGRWQTTFGNANRASAIMWQRAVVFAPNEPTWRSK